MDEPDEVEWWAGKSQAVYVGVVARVNWQIAGVSGEAVISPNQTLKGRPPKTIKVRFNNAPWVCGRDVFKRGEKVVAFIHPDVGPLVFHEGEVDMNFLRTYLARGND